MVSRVTVLVVAASALLAVLIFGALFGVAYGLSQYLEVPTAIVVTFACATLTFWLLLRLITQVLIFPGSMRYCAELRETECNERFSGELEWCITDLVRLLVCLKCASQGCEKVQAKMGQHCFSLERCRTAVVQLEMVKSNFSSQLADGCALTAQQQQLSSLASASAELLEKITVASSRGSNTLVAFLDDPQTALADLAPGTPADVLLVDRLIDGAQPELTSSRRGLLVEMKTLLSKNIASVQPTLSGSLGCCRRKSPRPLLGTLDFLRAELRCRHMGIPVRIPTTWAWGACAVLDGMLIPRRGLASPGDGGDGCHIDFSNEVVLLVIGPNAAYFENHAVNSDLLSMYLDLGFNVFLFNYRGYGRSTGSPTTWKLAKDGEAVVKLLKSRFNVRRFAVHGRSMGGYVASHIASKFGEVELIVADRTFSSLMCTASTALGSWAAVILAFVFAFASSVQTFMSRVDCYKVLICDPEDTVIGDAFSLRSHVAREVLCGVPPRGGHLAVSSNVCRAFLASWESLLKRCMAPARFDQDGDDVTMCEGDHVCWLHSSSEFPEGTYGEIKLLEGEGGVQGAWVTCSSGETSFLLLPDLVRVSGLDLLALQCLDTVGSLNAGGLSIRCAFSRHMLDRVNLSRAGVLRFWLDNLLVWGSRMARAPRAILAWKQRCLVAAAADASGENKTKGSVGDTGLLSTVLRHWDLDTFYCPDCGVGMASVAALDRHREALCGGMRTPAGLVVGDLVECRNPGGEWVTGVVSDIDPFEVTADDTNQTRVWNDVRHLLTGRLSADDIHQFSLEESIYEVAKASARLQVKAEELTDYLLEHPNAGSRGREVHAGVQALQAFVGQLVRYFETSSLPRSETICRTGRLIHCTCGHSGRLNNFALEQLMMHIQESGVVPNFR
eukprot:TRINITY_DN70483_c0_g1_i1.p1 TRINITY_DN70483_c0_g1~~TRINITY_DN70483_c0_g1_i1.p1  ORF type:complete len:898 (-),score=115.56 TRINITY_DN70483_c0_g1_i1:2-2695(-)